MTLTTEQFKNLPQNEQRIRLAQDVIQHLHAKKLIATSNLYIAFGGEDNHEEIVELNNHVELKEYAANNEVSCEVCAIGALFISEVMYTNDVSMPSIKYPESDKLYKRLSNYFKEDQLALIEVAFEMDSWYAEQRCPGLPQTEIEAAEDFGLEFDGDDDRMTAIMRNMIANNGKFIPPEIEE